MYQLTRKATHNAQINTCHTAHGTWHTAQAAPKEKRRCCIPSLLPGRRHPTPNLAHGCSSSDSSSLSVHAKRRGERARHRHRRAHYHRAIQRRRTSSGGSGVGRGESGGGRGGTGRGWSIQLRQPIQRSLHRLLRAAVLARPLQRAPLADGSRDSLAPRGCTSPGFTAGGGMGEGWHAERGQEG
jgi:hypothetical protein